MDNKTKIQPQILPNRNASTRRPGLGEILLTKAHLLCLLSTKEKEAALEQAFQIIRPHLKPDLSDDEVNMLKYGIACLRASFMSRCKSVEYNSALFKQAESDWLKSTVQVPSSLLRDNQRCANCQKVHTYFMGTDKVEYNPWKWKGKHQAALQTVFGGFLKKNNAEGLVNRIPPLCSDCSSLLLKMENIYSDFRGYTGRKSPIYLLLGKSQEVTTKNVLTDDPSEVQLEFSLMQEKCVPDLTKENLLCLLSRRQASLTLDEAILIVRPHLKPHLATKELVSLRYALLRLRNEFLALFELIQTEKWETITSKMLKFKNANETWLGSTVLVPSCLLKEQDRLSTTEPGPRIKRCFNCQSLRQGSISSDAETETSMKAFQTIFEGVLKLYSLELQPGAFPPVCQRCDSLLLDLHKVYVQFMDRTVEHSPIHLLFGDTAAWSLQGQKPGPPPRFGTANERFCNENQEVDDVNNRDVNPLSTVESGLTDVIIKPSSITTIVVPKSGKRNTSSNSTSTQIMAPETSTVSSTQMMTPEMSAVSPYERVLIVSNTVERSSLNKIEAIDLPGIQQEQNDTDRVLGDLFKTVYSDLLKTRKKQTQKEQVGADTQDLRTTNGDLLICLLGKEEEAGIQDALKLLRPHLISHLTNNDLRILRLQFQSHKYVFERMFNSVEQALPNTSTLRQIIEFYHKNATWLHSTIRLPARLMPECDKRDITQEQEAEGAGYDVQPVFIPSTCPETIPIDPMCNSSTELDSTPQAKSVTDPLRRGRGRPRKTGELIQILEHNSGSTALQKLSVSDSIRSNVVTEHSVPSIMPSTVKSLPIQPPKSMNSLSTLTSKSISSAANAAPEVSSAAPTENAQKTEKEGLSKRSNVNTVEAACPAKIRKLQGNLVTDSVALPVSKPASKVDSHPMEVEAIETATEDEQEMDVPHLKKADLLICLLGNRESALQDAIKLVRPHLKPKLTDKELLLLRDGLFSLKIMFKSMFKAIEQTIPKETVFGQMKKFSEVHANWLKSTIRVPKSLLLAEEGQTSILENDAEIKHELESVPDLASHSSPDRATSILSRSSPSINTLPSIDVGSSFAVDIKPDLPTNSPVPVDMDLDSDPDIKPEIKDNPLSLPDSNSIPDPVLTCPSPGPTSPQIELVLEVEHNLDKKCGNCLKVLAENVSHNSDNSLDAFRTVFQGIIPHYLVNRLPSIMPEICENCDSLLLSLHKLYVEFMSLAEVESPVRTMLLRSNFWKEKSNMTTTKTSILKKLQPKRSLAKRVKRAAKCNKTKPSSAKKDESTTIQEVQSSPDSDVNIVPIALEAMNETLKPVTLDLDPVIIIDDDDPVKVTTHSEPNSNPLFPIIVPSSVKSLSSSSASLNFTAPNISKELPVSIIRPRALSNQTTKNLVKASPSATSEATTHKEGNSSTTHKKGSKPETPNATPQSNTSNVPSVEPPSVISATPSKKTFRFFIVNKGQTSGQPMLRINKTNQKTILSIGGTRSTTSTKGAEPKSVSILSNSSRIWKTTGSSISAQRKPNPGVPVPETIPSIKLPSYTCSICGQPVEGKRAFDKHIASHDTPLLPCPHCELTFRGSSLLQRHIQATHMFSAESESPADDSVLVLDPGNESEQLGFYSEFVKVESEENPDGKFYSETGQLDLSTL